MIVTEYGPADFEHVTLETRAPLILTAGAIAYERDVAARPTYHDGTPRKQWHELGTVEQWSWERTPL